MQTVGLSIGFSIGLASYFGFFYTPLHTVSERKRENGGEAKPRSKEELEGVRGKRYTPVVSCSYGTGGRRETNTQRVVDIHSHRDK